MTKGELIQKLQELPVDDNTEVFVPSYTREGQFWTLDSVIIDGLTSPKPEILLSDNI